ncbi:hypothetical protein GCM10009551_080970 [Nocardiopsis tropica]|uniref:DUF7373 family lipoprotein n=1 Tax=Tsukamurella strandjordii TaxID=147577 RepID=UPI0031CF1A02
MAIRLLALALACSASAACSTEIAGSPAPKTSVAPIDTGGYNTVPRPVINGSKASQFILAGNFIGERIVSAVDIDPRLRFRTGYNGAMLAPTATLDAQATDMVVRNGFLYGFRSTSTSGTSEIVTVELWQTTGAEAAQTMTDKLRTYVGGRNLAPTAKYMIPVRDTTRPEAAQSAIEAVTSVGSIVVYVSAIVDHTSGGRRVVEQAIDRQVEALQSFTAPDERTALALAPDRDSIVSYTVRREAAQSNEGYRDDGYRSGRLQALLEEDTAATQAAFLRTGTDLAATGMNTVYRTRSEAAAKELRDHFFEEITLKGPILQFRTTVPNVPESACRTFQTTSAEITGAACVVSRGRYVSVVYVNHLEQARQVTAAAYAVLGHAR